MSGTRKHGGAIHSEEAVESCACWGAALARALQILPTPPPSNHLSGSAGPSRSSGGQGQECGQGSPSPSL
eukprot:570477-Rhodomonas_salina.1